MAFANPVAKGNSADIYLYHGKIIKLFRARSPDGEAEYEANKQRIAYTCCLPVPQVFGVTRVNGRQAIVMEHIEGPTFGELMRQDMGKAQDCLSLSVDIQIGMHSKSITALEPMRDKLARQLREADILNEASKASLLERLAGLPMENKLCHGDYHVFNLIKAENKTVIIDWIDSSAGNPCADVSRTHLLYSRFSSKLADAYLNLYCAKSGLSRSDILAWAPVIAGARLSENIPDEDAGRLLKIIQQYS